VPWSRYNPSQAAASTGAMRSKYASHSSSMKTTLGVIMWRRLGLLLKLMSYAGEKWGTPKVRYTNTRTIITVCFVWGVCDSCRGLWRVPSPKETRDRYRDSVSMSDETQGLSHLHAGEGDINTHTIITVCFVWGVCDSCRGLLRAYLHQQQRRRVLVVHQPRRTCAAPTPHPYCKIRPLTPGYPWVATVIQG
jgi:hypothetical protein